MEDVNKRQQLTTVDLQSILLSEGYPSLLPTYDYTTGYICMYVFGDDKFIRWSFQPVLLSLGITTIKQQIMSMLYAMEVMCMREKVFTYEK